MAETVMTETEDYDTSADPTDHASNHESGGSDEIDLTGLAPAAHASSHESGGADPIDNLGPITGLTISGDGVITWQGASLASKYLFDLRVSGDTNPRLKLKADGQIEWGPGNAATDSTLYRESANELATSGRFSILGNELFIKRPLTSDTGFSVRISGDSRARSSFECGGSIGFGPGNAGVDCQISRRTANIFNTPDRFEVGTLGVANSANATTPGNCQNKAEIFDAAGNSLGFIAIYDAIT